MRVKSFDYKLPKTKKMREWLVSPGSKADGIITVQTDGMCGMFIADTGKGVINRKCEYTGIALFATQVDGKLHFLHEHTQPYLWPAEFVALAKAHIPQSGDLIGSSPVCGSVYVA